ncbi:suppressor of hpr1 [Malassezia yamatoensis]|uniref:Mediator of RNA polymerase II transcription subunit 31 n=1 Tax=Malassezia yamatoensis TaxID=253288 RepID=A0AAJ5YSS1_9BASI|nr:suppressor of hpr1 [Malassezia yamatoensis]
MPTKGEEESFRQQNQQRFSRDLEFLSAVCNPFYLHQLSQQGYLDNPNFLRYLNYLNYFREPRYVQYLPYPQALYFLDLLTHAEFRMAVADTAWPHDTAAKQIAHWATWPAISKKFEPLRDDQITDRTVHIVDPVTNKLHGPYVVKDILHKLRHSDFSLIQVRPGEPQEELDPILGSLSSDPGRLGICKVISKREEYKKNRESKVIQKATKISHPVTKDLQLTWSVSDHDKKHKVDRAIKDLLKGNRIKIVILSKKGTPRVYPGTKGFYERLDFVHQLINELCYNKEQFETIASVTHGPDWKNHRSVCEVQIAPVEPP